MFSDYNGIQVFIYPITIFYWISSSSIFLALSTLLSVKLHYLPITFWAVLLVYTLFIMLKIYTIYFRFSHKESPHLNKDFWDSVIRLHKRLFVVLLALMVLFVLTEFLRYFYGISLPMKQFVVYAFRLFTIIIILYYYFSSMWLKPYRERNYGSRRSEKLCYLWMLKNPLGAIKYTGLLFLMIFAAVRLYVLVITYIYKPFLLGFGELFGLSLHLEMVSVASVGHMFYNVFILAAAFILSNLGFFPILYLMQILAKRLHPIRLQQVSHVQN